MDTDERRLDGNAAAGTLREIFLAEMTVVETVCASCGAMNPLGAQMVYADAPGLVIRCTACEAVLIRIVHAETRYWLDMHGAACMQIDIAAPAAETGDRFIFNGNTHDRGPPPL